MTEKVLFVRGLPDESYLSPAAMEKPDSVPDDWEIYNAPRPLYGHEHWKGKFRSGIFYVAIDPGADYADEYRKRTLQNDGHHCVFIDKDVVIEWFRARAEHYDVDPDEFDFSAKMQSYMSHWRDGRIE